MTKLKQSEVLCYNSGKSQNTFKKYYLEWRAQQNPAIPYRCDNNDCKFFTDELMWNGKSLQPILDHKNGANKDNRPENLQFLCPNCDSQLATKGGGNKCKVKQKEGGYAHVRDDGKNDYVLPADPAEYKFIGNDVNFTNEKK